MTLQKRILLTAIVSSSVLSIILLFINSSILDLSSDVEDPSSLRESVILIPSERELREPSGRGSSSADKSPSPTPEPSHQLIKQIHAVCPSDFTSSSSKSPVFELPPLPVTSPVVEWAQWPPQPTVPVILVNQSDPELRLRYFASGQTWSASSSNLTYEDTRSLADQLAVHYEQILGGTAWRRNSASLGELRIQTLIGDFGAGSAWGYVIIQDCQLQLLDIGYYFIPSGDIDSPCPCDLKVSVFLSDVISLADLSAVDLY